MGFAPALKDVAGAFEAGSWIVAYGAASIVIGAILAVTALLLARETKGLLIGESANREVVARIRSLAARYPEVPRVHEILDGLDRDIKRADPRVKRVFIEVQNECPPRSAPAGAASAARRAAR